MSHTNQTSELIYLCQILENYYKHGKMMTTTTNHHVTQCKSQSTHLLMAITLWPPEELNRTFVSCSFFTISSSVRGLRGLRPREPILIITLYVPPCLYGHSISCTKYIVSLCAVPGCCDAVLQVTLGSLDLETTFLFFSFVLNTEADTRQDTAPCRPRTPQAFLTSCVYIFMSED